MQQSALSSASSSSSSSSAAGTSSAGTLAAASANLSLLGDILGSTQRNIDKLEEVCDTRDIMDRLFVRSNDDKLKVWLKKKFDNIMSLIKEEKMYMPECCFRADTENLDAFQVDDTKLKELVIDIVGSYLCAAHVKLLREAVLGEGEVKKDSSGDVEMQVAPKEIASPQRGGSADAGSGGAAAASFVQPNRIVINKVEKVEGEPPVKKAKVDKPKVKAHGMFGSMFAKAMKKK